jgi:ferrochelatase
MSRFIAEPSYTHGQPARTGVLLVNLGTPDKPDAASLRVYLKQFLSDDRVVEIPKRVWWFILNVIILNVRPKQSAEKYALVWTRRGLAPARPHRTTGKAVAWLDDRAGQTGHRRPLRHALRQPVHRRHHAADEGGRLHANSSGAHVSARRL